MTIIAGTKTYPPTVKVGKTEKKKYEEMWEREEYRAFSPGEVAAMDFLQHAKPLKDSTCIDFGCGTGRGGLMISLFGQMIVTLVDFASNALDEDVKNATITQPHRISWVEADLSKEIPVQASYGYCTDVMEHIPPEQVDAVLQNIFRSANHVYFQISCEKDHCGALIGEHLHLTVQPYEWWLKKLQEHGAIIHWSAQDDEGRGCRFYASSWAPFEEIEYEGKVNTATEQVLKNIRHNAESKKWLEMQPHEVQDTPIMVLCGGPSLNDYEEEIRELRSQGMPMITCNGTYNWAIERGMIPSLQLILDARPFNKRFLRPLVDTCKYFIASQCDPELFEGMPEDRTYLWHCTGSDEAKELLNDLYKIWYAVPGGSTVTLRGLCLLRMLGFHKIHMYGFDSCYRDGDHHAYKQSENEYKAKRVIPVSVGGRVFQCDPWMLCQAQEWMQMVGAFGDEIDLDVKGDGLIAHIIKTGAELSALDEVDED